MEIKVFYKSRQIGISFNESFKPNDLIINTQMRMATSVITDTGESMDSMNILQFACNNKDECSFFPRTYRLVIERNV